ncbi:MAG: NUDIX domain-containing protein [Bacteroidales bacterium]|jgi:8-oxo-dGTP pyrophosphatase MutT (NUDIX family)|nr:NUDIX domain-containing protein [Bacteroidales bacterium]
MYKVFYNQRIVFFVDQDNSPEENSKYIKHCFENRSLLYKVVDEFAHNENVEKLLVVHPDVDFVFKQFASFFTIIEAAGGLVKTPDHKFLAIFRRGVWDLPKGKLESSESTEEGALREVTEECGIDGMQLKKQLTVTWHTYTLENHPVLKKTTWYEMEHPGQVQLTPQLEEDITRVQWIGRDEQSQVIRNTYPSILEVLTQGGIISP